MLVSIKIMEQHINTNNNDNFEQNMQPKDELSFQCNVKVWESDKSKMNVEQKTLFWQKYTTNYLDTQVILPTMHNYVFKGVAQTENAMMFGQFMTEWAT